MSFYGYSIFAHRPGIELSIKRYFHQFIISHSPIGRQLLWDSVYSFVRDNIQELQGSIYLETFIKCLLKLLSEFDCPDAYLVSRIFALYHTWITAYNEDVSIEEISMLKNRLCQILENMKFKPLSYEVDIGEEHESIMTSMCIKRSDYEYMRLLAKYGFSCHSIGRHEREIALAILSLSKFLSNIKSVSMTEEEEIVDHEFESDAAARDFIMLYIECCHENLEFRVMLIIVKQLETVARFLSRDTSYYEYAKCLRLYFLTISEPFIAEFEVKQFLRLLKNMLESLERRTFIIPIKELCDLYTEIFPESKIKLGARTMKHLCRCKVREILQQSQFAPSKTLPDMVVELDISLCLKKYILYEFDEEEEYKECIKKAKSLNEYE